MAAGSWIPFTGGAAPKFSKDWLAFSHYYGKPIAAFFFINIIYKSWIPWILAPIEAMFGCPPSMGSPL